MLAVTGTLKMCWWGETAKAADIPFIGNWERNRCTDALQLQRADSCCAGLPWEDIFQSIHYICASRRVTVHSIIQRVLTDMKVLSADSERVTSASCMLEYACFGPNCSAREAVTQTDCDCCGGGKCNEAACVPRMNNQHPSEVMGGPRIRGSRRVCGGEEGARRWQRFLLEPCVL